MKNERGIRTDRIIEDYRQEHQPWFEQLNRDWIEKHFWMEPIDVEVLQHPEEHIVNKGGAILMVRCNDRIVATVALKFVKEGVFEFTKMAVASEFRGTGIGEELSRAAIRKARELGARKIILYSSTKLEPAINLYRKIGFREVPLDGPYKRSDIKMELPVEADYAYRVRPATTSDSVLLRRIGISTFRETFGIHNTQENMDAYVEEHFSIAKIKNELSDPNNMFLILNHLENAVGYAKLRMSTPPGELGTTNAIEIERFYSIKEYIGRKVGQNLMEGCLRYASRMGFSKLWLGVWEHNHRAIAFYEKWGFIRFGEHEFILGEDRQTDLLMSRSLNG